MLLFNHADSDFGVKEGDRVAQLVLERVSTNETVMVELLMSVSRSILPKLRLSRNWRRACVVKGGSAAPDDAADVRRLRSLKSTRCLP